MPPLATVGFGLATLNATVFFGALLLFVTNLMTIAIAAAVMARLYGFGPKLTSRQSGMQNPESAFRIIRRGTAQEGNLRTACRAR